MNIATSLDVLKLIGEIIGAVSTAAMLVYGAIRTLPVLLNHARLLHERDSARAQVTELEAYIRAFDRVGDMVATLDARMARMELTQVLSTRYTADLIIHIREQRPISEMPPIPPELSDAVLAELRFRSTSHAT